MSVVRLRVTDPILAVSATPKNPPFVIIPVGTVLETTENLKNLGLHSVRFDGQEMLVFTKDIQERTVRVLSLES